MNKTKWIIFAVVVVAIFGGIIALNKKSPSGSSGFTGDATKVISTGPIADHVFGTNAQRVTLIEYGDFECPGCGAMYSPIKDLTTKYQNQVTFIFRNFPLTNIHPNALAAATAAEAAGLQGKYWEMHDKLYESQNAWATVSVSQREDVFAGYASELGLDATKFKNDLASADISAKIARDQNTGTNTFHVDSTPTWVLNGKVISGSNAVSADYMTQAVENAVGKAYPTDSPAQGSPKQ